MRKKMFFLDDEELELRFGVERVFHQPVKHGRPVMAPRTVLEGEALHLFTPPLPSGDGPPWRMWYVGREMIPLYAESDDGLDWRRPALGLVECGGGRDNNVVDLGFTAAGKERILAAAPDPSGDRPEKRYCGLVLHGRTLKTLFSADGLRWQPCADGPGLFSDDQYRLACDPEKKQFIATVKLYGFAAEAGLAVPEYGRAVGLATSPDGVNWTEPRFIYHSDARDRSAGREILSRHLADPDYRSPVCNDPRDYWTDVYNMPVFPYHGLYLGLPTMFQHSGYWIANAENANQDGLLWPALAWSRDLLRWERPERRDPFIPLSPCADREVYDNGGIHACLPIRRGNELWFYYNGSRNSHINPAAREKNALDYAGEKPAVAVFLARLRVDGFASMRAGENRGGLITRPVVVSGRSLRVNARTRNGEVLAEIRDVESGRAIPGYGMGEYLGPGRVAFAGGAERPRLAGPGTRRLGEAAGDEAVPFSGDAVDAPMSWRGGRDLSPLKGRLVRLAFGLRNADLYSCWFE